MSRLSFVYLFLSVVAYCKHPWCIFGAQYNGSKHAESRKDVPFGYAR